jgi:hypothetical protein
VQFQLIRGIGLSCELRKRSKFIEKGEEKSTAVGSGRGRKIKEKRRTCRSIKKRDLKRQKKKKEKTMG